MNKQELIIFTGNIGCGKSFLAKDLARQNYVIVNNDAITTMVQGGNYELYDTEKKGIYRHIEYQAAKIALDSGFSVVIDRSNMTILDRKRYIDLGKLIGVPIRSFDWGRGDIQSLCRRLADMRGISAEQWRDVHRSMQRLYEAPTLTEGFVEIRKMGGKCK